MPHKEEADTQAPTSTSTPKITPEEIGPRINELLAEREKLFRSLKEHEFRRVSTLFSSAEYAKSPKLKEAIEDGLGRIRKETEFLQPLDSLGIRIFVDDLENQPSDEELKIEFNSEDVHEENIMNMSNVGGWASKYSGKIDVAGYKPPLNHQVAGFIQTGELHPSIQVLIHEMIHWGHYMRSTRSRINSVLTESQAYLSEAIVGGSRKGIVHIQRILTDPKGLYKYDEDEALEGLVGISGLMAQGLSQDEIAHLVANSCYDHTKRDFSTLTEHLNQGNLDSLDLQALGDIYKLNLTNQRLKAQLLMYETLEDHFPAKVLKEAHLKDLRKHIALPVYHKDGEQVPAEALYQSMICPANDDWPYDAEGLRTGILWGYVENDDHQYEFALGKLSATPKDSTFIPAKTHEEQERLLNLIKEQAPEIFQGAKKRLIGQWFAKFQVESTLPSSILEAVLSREDILSFFKEIQSGLIKEFSMMQEGLEDFRPDQLRKKIMVYTWTIARYEELLSIFGVNATEVSPDFAEMLDALKEKLVQVKDIYEKEHGPIEILERKAA